MTSAAAGLARQPLRDRGMALEESHSLPARETSVAAAISCLSQPIENISASAARSGRPRTSIVTSTACAKADSLDADELTTADIMLRYDLEKASDL